MRLEEIARASQEVGQTSARLAKIERLAACLALLAPGEIPVAVAYLAGELPQGTIGVGWATLRELPAAASQPGDLQLLDVDGALTRLQAATGTGSRRIRRAELDALFGRATELERSFLVALLTGELRQGALSGVMVEAIARAAGLPAPDVRRALMLAGDLGAVAGAALAEGAPGLARFRLEVLRPLLPMLAQTAADLGDALGRAHPAVIEWKLDGARIQVHRLGEEVRVYTRTLADITERVPELAATVARLPVEAVVLDGEAIALRADGRPHTFQITMSRFGSKLDVDRLRAAVPLSAFFFDCLHLDGRDLLGQSARERFAALERVLPEALRLPRVETADLDEGERFLEETLGRGHEGVVVKALDAPYEAGRRGAGWLKVKRAHTLDLVVLAAEWGHGRRRGHLSNLHLGARNPGGKDFVMLGKTFKGMTDEMLVWQTKRLLDLETNRDGITVYVRPEVVVEVAFDGLQESTRYPGGLALRFARVKRYRSDKTADEADTIDTVRLLHRGSAGSGA